MQLPALMYKSLGYTKKAETDDDLISLLVLKPPDLIKFLVKACDDETWADGHPVFMRKALTWITDECFQDRLMMSFVRRVAQVIREHYSVLLAYLPLNLTVKLKDKDVRINGLLLSASSEYLRVMVRRDCRDNSNRTTLNFQEIPYAHFDVIEAFVNTESTFDLVRKDKPIVIKILKLAMQWELEELSKACQDYLKKYITEENVFDTLIRAHQKQRTHLREACFEFANNLQLGYRFENRGLEYLGFEFIEFSENSLAAFELVRLYVTHLIFSGKLTEDPTFVKIIYSCPKLICLDISRSKTFSDQLKEIPETLQELEVSDCPWMNNDNFALLLALCPELSSLTLISDVEISAEGWGALQNLDQLRSLNLTRCVQLTDGDLQVVLQASKSLTTLHLEECRRLTDLSFSEIPKYVPGLVNLNLARTWISMLPLIEIATNCKSLIKIDLTHCEHVDEATLIEILRNAHELREVNVSHCDISKTAVVALRKRFKFVQIIIN